MTPLSVSAYGSRASISGDAGDAAGGDHRGGDGAREFQRLLDVETLQHSVAGDVRVDERRGAGILEAAREVERRHGGGLGPALGRHTAVARVDADGDAVGMRAAGLAYERGVLGRGAAENDAGDAGAEPRLDRRHVTDAAAELYRNRDGREDRTHRFGVDGLAGKGAVEIDDVQPAAAGLGEAAGLGGGVVGVDRGLRHLAAAQAHAASFLEVNRGIEREGHGGLRVSLR